MFRELFSGLSGLTRLAELDVQELCARGFSGLKGPLYGHYTWHMSLGTRDRQQARKRCAQSASGGCSG